MIETNLTTHTYSIEPICSPCFPFIKERHDTYKTSKPITENEIIQSAKIILACRANRYEFRVGSTQICKDYFIMHLAEYEHEVFSVIFLDTKHHIIAREILSTGALNTVTVSIREIVKRSLKHNAASVILAHNHPSGDTTPSDADIKITLRIIQALEMVEIKVVDHIIVGANASCLSFAEKGFL